MGSNDLKEVWLTIDDDGVILWSPDTELHWSKRREVWATVSAAGLGNVIDTGEHLTDLKEYEPLFPEIDEIPEDKELCMKIKVQRKKPEEEDDKSEKYPEVVCMKCGLVESYSDDPVDKVGFTTCQGCSLDEDVRKAQKEIERIKKLEENQPYEQCDATIPSWGRWVQCEKPAGHTGFHHCTMDKRSSIEWEDEVKENKYV